MKESSNVVSNSCCREYHLCTTRPYLVFRHESGTVRRSPLRETIHFHDAVEIGLCRAEGSCLLVNGKQFLLHPGSCFVIPPYIMHATMHLPKEDCLFRNDSDSVSGCCEPPASLSEKTSDINSDVNPVDYLYYSPESVRQSLYPGIPSAVSSAGLLSWKDCPIPERPSSDTIRELLEILFTGAVSHSETNKKAENRLCPAAVLSLLDALTICLAKSEGEAPSIEETAAPAVLHALQEINGHYLEPLNIEALASGCGLSSRQLRTAFAALMHTSIREYVQRLRLDDSCTLLLQTHLPVIDVALQSGFSSLSAFQKAFQAQYRQQPSQWRSSFISYNENSLIRQPYRPEELSPIL
jgi:AraC family transcriptional regulator, activator of mtrCDE